MLLVAAVACGGGGDEDGDSNESTNQKPTITGEPEPAVEGSSYEFMPSVDDPDGDELTLSIENKPDWLNFDDATGALTGTPSAQDVGMVEDITIKVSDGDLSDSLNLSMTVNYDPLEEAIRTGKASIVEEEQVYLDGALTTINDNQTAFDDALVKLFQLGDNGEVVSNSLSQIDWDPTHDAALLSGTFGFNHPILISNAVTNDSYSVNNRTLGIVGKAEDTRYFVLGSNPMRTWKSNPASVNTQMQQFLQNSLSWLTRRDDLDAQPFKVAMAHLGQSYYFPDQIATREWLQNYYPDTATFNAATECNGAALSGCISEDTDLLIVSQVLDGASASAVANAVKQAMESGVSVLYLHHDGNNGELAQTLFPLFNVYYEGDNYWQRQSLSQYDGSSQYAVLPEDVASVKDLLSQFKNQSFNINLGLCDDKSCPAESNYDSNFLQAAKVVQNYFRRLDRQKISIFSSTHYRYEKILMLLADFYRQSVQYPMDKIATPTTDFLKSMYADHAVYMNRDIAPAQADLGNFSRSDFSHITPSSKVVELTSKPPFRTAGVYALPGQKFEVTRQDSNAVQTKIFINTLRSGATHEFNENSYNRPKFLRTTDIEIKPGETLSLISTHGGPVQVGFDVKDVAVKFEFATIGQHPVWREEADSAAFAQAVNAENYDWAELITPSFEVHSTTEKMQETLSDPLWPDANSVALATMRYAHNFALGLAGYSGPGIDLNTEVTSFTQNHNLTIASIDQVKHMNADQANCGYGCSGNPYDAYWSFNPVGHGDIHEIGHGLERSLFRFSGWEVHTTTNPYSYYAKSQFHLETGNAPSCQSLPFEELFNHLQQSRNEADPFAYMQSANLSSWSRGAAFYLQLMMSAQGDGALGDGWQLWPRLHILEREFRKARGNDTDWNAMRDNLGFAGWTREQANSISSNDWMLISSAFAMKRDTRDYFSLWGLDFSDAAEQQVASYGFSVLPRYFYLANESDYCLGLDKSRQLIDGSGTWPY